MDYTEYYELNKKISELQNKINELNNSIKSIQLTYIKLYNISTYNKDCYDSLYDEAYKWIDSLYSPPEFNSPKPIDIPINIIND